MNAIGMRHGQDAILFWLARAEGAEGDRGLGAATTFAAFAGTFQFSLK